MMKAVGYISLVSLLFVGCHGNPESYNSITPRVRVQARIDSLLAEINGGKKTYENYLKLGLLYYDLASLQSDRTSNLTRVPSYNLLYRGDSKDSLANAFLDKSINALENARSLTASQPANAHFLAALGKAHLLKIGVDPNLPWVISQNFRKRLSQAGDFLKTALTADSTNWETWYWYGLTMSTRQVFFRPWLYHDSIRYCLTKASELQPNIGEPLLALGYNLGDHLAMRRAYEKGLQSSFSYVQMASYPGDLHHATEIYDYEHSLTSVPSFAKSYFLIGLKLLRKTESERTVDLYEKALAINPENWQAAFKLSSEYDLRGDVERAISYYKRCLSINPGQTLGSAWSSLNHSDEFIKHLSAEYPYELEVLMNTASVFARKGQFDQFQKYSAQIYSRSDISEDGYLRLGYWCSDSALSVYQKGLQKFPHSGILYYRIGFQYFRMHRLDDAVNALERAFELGIDWRKDETGIYWRNYNDRSGVPTDREWQKILDRLFKHVKSRQSQDSRSYYLLGKLANDSKTALSCYQKALEVNPGNLDYYFAAERVCTGLKDDGAAIRYLERIDSIYVADYGCEPGTQNFGIALHYEFWADQSEKKGNVRDAVKYYKFAIERSGDYATLFRDPLYRFYLAHKDTVSILVDASHGITEAQTFLEEHGIAKTFHR